MIILGIDPGTARTGYGLIETKEKDKGWTEPSFLACGCVETSPSLSNQERLREVYNEINKIIKQYQPKVIAVEKIFFFKNAKTIIQVSEARGILLLLTAQKKIPLYEFTPLQVKMNIVGYGRAQKKQIQKMVKELLKLEKEPKPDDAADALAIAISCSRLLQAQNIG